MPHASRLAAPLLAVALTAAPLLAQTSEPSTGAPVVGLANLSLGAGIGPFPSGTQWSASFGYVPFVTDHLQIGGGFSYGGSNGPYGRQLGSVTASGRYLFGPNPRSAPYLAASVSENGGQKQAGTFAASASVGWLHFLTPLTAVDARVSAAHYSNISQTSTSLSVSPSVFVAGLRSILGPLPQSPQTGGAFDWTGSADVGLSPGRHFGASAQYAPFFNEVFQMGGGGAANYAPAQSGLPNTHSLTGMLFLRAYYPADLPLRPFVELYGTDQSAHSGATTNDTRLHGASLGARHYLSPELAVDLRLRRETSDYINTASIGGTIGQIRFATHTTRTVFSAGLVLHQPHW